MRVSSASWRDCSCRPSSRRVAVVGGCSQGVGVVVAEDPAAAGEGVLGELAGLLVSP